MKGIKLLKPQPSPKSGRDPLSNISNCFFSRPKSDKQTYRSPSHSPRNTNRSTYFDHQRKNPPVSKQPVQARLTTLTPKCINHKQRAGRFRVQGQTQMGCYCQNCAFQLSQKGKHVVLVKNEEAGNRMVGEAKQFLKACEDALGFLMGKLNSLHYEKTRVETKFAKVKDEIEEERKEIIRKVNEQYDRECRQQQQSRKKVISKLEEELVFFGGLEREFQTVKKDVNQNLKEISSNIELAQFREIMDFYWHKVNRFNDPAFKLHICTINDSAHLFAAKYLPPDPKHNNRTFEQTLRAHPNHSKEFTFSKNIWALQSRVRQAFSWQNSNPVTESMESVVEQKFNIQ